jgi:hypothetical protein
MVCLDVDWPSAVKSGKRFSRSLCGGGVATGFDGDGEGVADGVGAGRDGTAWVGRGVGLATSTALGEANAAGSVQPTRATIAAAASAAHR